MLWVNEVSVDFERGLRFTIIGTLEFEVGVKLTVEVIIIRDRWGTREKIEWLRMIVVVTADNSLEYDLL